jgi:UDP-N-acetylglucosamine--dolichyl-phosphate N-acetylglucosaminephosphotransferase
LSVTLYISMLIAFATTFLITPFTIRYFRAAGLVDRDVHKRNTPILPHSMGLPVVAGILLSILFYVFVNVFVHRTTSNLLTIFAALTSILLITLIGLLDDINIKQNKVKNLYEGKRGLRRWVKPLFTLPAALPLMAIMAGTTTMIFPVIGEVQFGILYPLLIVPIGIVGASNMINMLGGFNGLETGMGLIYTLALGIFAWMNGSLSAALLFLATFAALLGAFKFNFYPAKILPGDSLTYLLGAVVATGAVIGNIEKAAILVTMPFIINGILKFYSYAKFGFFPSSLGILQKDGTIKSRHKEKVYSLTHLVMYSGNFSERQIVLILIGVQAVFATLPFLNIF